MSVVRPGRACHSKRQPGRHQAHPGVEIRHAGRRHQRAHPLPGDRLAALALPHRITIGADHVVALERPPGQLDPRHPLDACHAVPARHHQAQRPAVLRRQGLAVHRPGEQHALVQRVRDRKAALVALDLVRLHAGIEACEHRLERALSRARLLEQGAKRRPGPLGGADRLQEPGLAARPRAHARPTVAGAFHGHPPRDRRPRHQIGEPERQLAPDEAPQLEPEALRPHDRDVEVHQQIVQPRRRDVVAQRLERHAPVARRELQLLDREVGIFGRRPIGLERRERGQAVRFFHNLPGLLRAGAGAAHHIPKDGEVKTRLPMGGYPMRRLLCSLCLLLLPACAPTTQASDVLPGEQSATGRVRTIVNTAGTPVHATLKGASCVAGTVVAVPLTSVLSVVGDKQLQSETYSGVGRICGGSYALGASNP